MALALAAGRKALPQCKPNPPIGCVLVKQDQVIATGYTQTPGQHHAEAMALSQVDGPLCGVTAFVTLEPCSFHGRTPSCAKALVARGIKSVYIGMIDPHPKNQGQGLSILKQAGIEVQVGVLQKQVQADLQEHLIHDLLIDKGPRRNA